MTSQAGLLLILSTAVTVGCLRTGSSEVVVYTAHDREFSEPIFDAFTEQTGIRVLAKYDTESTKTVGLTKAILAEADRPRCDVFWNNEILNTIRLERRGMLAEYRPPSADALPDNYRSGSGRWHGFAARARVLIVNRRLVDPMDYPKSVLELADPKWKGRVAIAKPLFGTTATHAAILFAQMGEDDAQSFWRAALANAQILSGNKQVARAVASGQAAWGLTDTDDAIAEVDGGFPVEIVLPDQAEGGIGTPLIPNTVSMTQGCPHRAEAMALIAYLISPAVESRLATGQSAQIPLLPGTQAKSRLALLEPLKDVSVTFDDAADHWATAAEFLRREFIEN